MVFSEFADLPDVFCLIMAVFNKVVPAGFSLSVQLSKDGTDPEPSREVDFPF